ncbi:hypothetical protein QBC47DRAFT_406337 [Echria macrotheca]|uniref:Uncharacterized protein n=1 Tax=Echria macrotheca TaxID=438768 RepID=A0AAJ0B3P4_9PEZI|nr:hypothetical protein QBC47DRAFT_406337 [Echria macrotheca]
MDDSNPPWSDELPLELEGSEGYSEFANTLKRNTDSEGFELPPESCSTWVNAPNPDTYISFGDGGVTASVNAHGSLMQFGRYMGVGISGFFMADQYNTPLPHYVEDRAAVLLELCSERIFDYGISLLEDDLFCKRPRLKYVYDRWPRFEHEPDTEAGLSLVTQWVIHDGTVLQQLVVTNLLAQPNSIGFKYRGNMKICDLDFLGLSFLRESTECTECRESTESTERSGPHGYSRLNFWHEPTAEDDSVSNVGTTVEDDSVSNGGTTAEDDVVMTVMSVYIDGKAKKLEKDTTDIALDIGANKSVEVVVAYRMLLLPKGEEAGWKKFLIEAEATDVNAILRDTYSSGRFTTSPLPGLQLSTPTSIPDTRHGATWDPEGPGIMPLEDPSRHLDFIVRRHLEHILSVCAIPAPELSEDTASERESVAVTPVALTCGDFSGHRISTSASYFAFQFLVNMYRNLRAVEDSKAIASLRDRIYLVCRGHIEWLCVAWERGLEDLKMEKIASVPSSPRPDAAPGCFKSNYWVTGQAMGTTWTAPSALTDTAFQLIKMGEFASLVDEDLKAAKTKADVLGADELECKLEDDLKRVRELMERSGSRWQRALVRLDPREANVWPRALKPGEDVVKFRLDDQVWIWKAMESMMVDQRVRKPVADEHERQQVDRLRFLMHSDLPRIIFRNFTTENDSSGKTMLAVTRSARESRFLLHARDTALFYGIGWGLPLEEPSLDVWENTLEAQVHHVENEETKWGNAIRYALAIVLGCRKRRINKRPPAELVKSAFRVLLLSTSASGFFPGLLDGNTKKPLLFEEEENMDFYFHASFEIPFVLFQHAAQINALHNELAGAPVDQGEGTTKETEKRKKREGPSESPKTAVMKKTVPFNSLLDSTSIVTLDEEWLYPYPAFLQRYTTLIFSDEAEEDELATSSGGSDCLLYREDSDNGDLEELGVVRPALEGVVLKIEEKRKNLQGSAEPRAADFFPLRMRRQQYPTSSTGTSAVDNFFSDHTSRVLNRWESEFHISFHQLVDKLGSTTNIPTPYKEEFPTGSAKKLTRAAMGFRFQGDLFDRHWTCHFIQCVPRWADGKQDPLVKVKKLKGWQRDSNPYLGLPSPDTDQRSWWQRKVLELILVDRMLAEAVRSTRGIVEEVRSGLVPHSGEPLAADIGDPTSIFGSEDYFASKRQYLRLVEMLQLVEDELELVFTTLAKWETREKDRGHERPRWTHKDESRYRESIRRLTESTSRRTQELQTSRTRIVGHKNRLTASLDALRDDLAFMGSDNIGLFTYVTIFFLPAGFATSIFSMNGRPDSGLVGTMVIVAVVALVATTIALFNMRRIVHRFTMVSQYLHKNSSNAMKQTVLYDKEAPASASSSASISSPEETDPGPEETDPGPEETEPGPEETDPGPEETDPGPEETEPGPEETDPGPEKGNTESTDMHDDHRLPGQKSTSSWHVRFWITYMLVELPPRRVLLACYAMTKRNGLHWAVLVWRVGAGLVLLPVFVLSWFLRMLAYTTADISAPLWRYFVSLLPGDPQPEPEEQLRKNLQKLTHPPNLEHLKFLATTVTKSVQSRRAKKTAMDDSKKTEEV